MRLPGNARSRLDFILRNHCRDFDDLISFLRRSFLLVLVRLVFVYK